MCYNIKLLIYNLFEMIATLRAPFLKDGAKLIIYFCLSKLF